VFHPGLYLCVLVIIQSRPRIHLLSSAHPATSVAAQSPKARGPQLPSSCPATPGATRVGQRRGRYAVPGQPNSARGQRPSDDAAAVPSAAGASGIGGGRPPLPPGEASNDTINMLNELYNPMSKAKGGKSFQPASRAPQKAAAKPALDADGDIDASQDPQAALAEILGLMQKIESMKQLLAAAEGAAAGLGGGEGGAEGAASASGAASGAASASVLHELAGDVRGKIGAEDLPPKEEEEQESEDEDAADESGVAGNLSGLNWVLTVARERRGTSNYSKKLISCSAMLSE